MSITKIQLVDWLDDLCVRFIINLPREELESVERICFQVEEAQWFYEDFIRPLDPALPSLNLQTFSLRIFQHCPLLSQWSHYHHLTAFQEFLAYKKRVPVRGAIMLNQAMDEVVLVKGWKKGANWSFPRGKINKDEKDLDCAVREVYEETGFDIRAAGLVDEKNSKHIDFTIREQDMRLFVFRGVPKDTHFEPKTRKEISKIDWYKLTDLPTYKKAKTQEGTGESLINNSNKFYMVAPFLYSLKKWIAYQRKLDAAKMTASVPEAVALVPEQPPATSQHHAPLALPDEIDTGAPSDLPEVLISTQGQQDASDHLKRLLNINKPGFLQQSTLDPEPVQLAPQQASVLELFKNVEQPTGSSDTMIPFLQHRLPQTPMEQIQQPPQFAPRPPHHQHPHLQPQQHFTPPPQFPLQPQVFAQQTQDFQRSFQNQHQHAQRMGPAIPGPQQRTGFSAQEIQALRHLTQQSQHNNQRRNGPLLSDHISVPQRAGTSSFSAAGPPQAAAPFRRTGDPDFTPDFDASSRQGPAIPPAHKLPPPHLNNHTLSLLNAFKGVPASPQPAPASVPAPTAPSSFPNVHQQQVPSTIGPSHMQKQRGVQQTALLDLFRKPSAPAALNAAPAPTLPSAQQPRIPAQRGPIELSAATSPTKATAFQEMPVPAQVSPIKLLQREKPRPAQAGAARTSATISGPLPTPNFSSTAAASNSTSRRRAPADKRVKRPRAYGSDAEGAVSSANEGPTSQFTILARQAGVNNGSAVPLRSPHAKETRQAQRSSTHINKKSKDTPVTEAFLPAKPTFQPQQILRRPQADQEKETISSKAEVDPIAHLTKSLQSSVLQSPPFQDIKAATSPISVQPTKALVRPQPNQAPSASGTLSQSFDRRTSQTESNKAALLSLFGKPNPASPPIASSPSPNSATGHPAGATGIKSPLSIFSKPTIMSPPPQLHAHRPSASATRTGSLVVSPMDESAAQLVSRSRVSSLADGVGDTNGNGNGATGVVSPIATAKAAPAPVNRDRDFLLGYLNSVTRK